MHRADGNCFPASYPPTPLPPPWRAHGRRPDLLEDMRDHIVVLVQSECVHHLTSELVVECRFLALGTLTVRALQSSYKRQSLQGCSSWLAGRAAILIRLARLMDTTCTKPKEPRCPAWRANSHTPDLSSFAQQAANLPP